jgi:hypothetical protein
MATKNVLTRYIRRMRVQENKNGKGIVFRANDGKIYFIDKTDMNKKRIRLCHKVGEMYYVLISNEQPTYGYVKISIDNYLDNEDDPSYTVDALITLILNTDINADDIGIDVFHGNNYELFKKTVMEDPYYDAYKQTHKSNNDDMVIIDYLRKKAGE